MHQISFSARFEEEATALSLDHSTLDKIGEDLKKHLDAIHRGTGEMPVPYLGNTSPFTYPQSAYDAPLYRIHVFDINCPNFNDKEQTRWNKASQLHHRTSDTYFVFTRNFLSEFECRFIGVISDAHNTCRTNKTWYVPFVEEADRFNNI
ncbi:type II toxin-antitoxin system YafO family toxin [Salinivibrio sp. ES.052]|uniref:type II toxin-antitoxin system YafO family toxin n=1 Tax=Salinivibrio sp. ES.052 TaxID=1882823 RepID=UPI000925CB2A|nr:type II toxin-antitoxin system YafO family toxin [Salinivibrio sp. ES.052]SIO27688.1 Toxin YafO, type II toxin-antitoxin system [Salinivibrio sp. ES.052]